MNGWFFTLKKTLRSVLTWVFCLLLAALLPAAFAVGREASRLPAGCTVTGEADEEAAMMRALLEEDGFLPFGSEEELRSALAAGVIEAGAVIPGDLGKRLKTGEREEAVTFIEAGGSLFGMLWRSHAAAALMEEAAPYIALEALDGSGVTQEELKTAYRAMLAEGSRFRFLTETAEGKPIPEDTGRSRRYMLAAASLFLFAGLFFGAVRPLGEETARMKSRIGVRKAFLAVFVPGVWLRAMLLWLAAASGFLLAGQGMKLPLLTGVYLLMILPVQFLIVRILPGRNASSTAVTLILLASLALCPVFADLAGLVPLISRIRLFCPPYWLYLLAG
jgi:hypothetical protein